jgi:hypothetical protein
MPRWHNLVLRWIAKHMRASDYRACIRNDPVLERDCGFKIAIRFEMKKTNQSHKSYESPTRGAFSFLYVLN